MHAPPGTRVTLLIDVPFEQETIELHLPPEQFEILKAAEESERDIITRLVRKIARKRLR